MDRLGAAAVSAVDPSPPFVDAVRTRLPGVDVRSASAEDLPFADGGFDAALAQLVVHFMTDPVAGLASVESTSLSVTIAFATLAEWWEPFTLGVGPAGAYVAGLDGSRRERLRTRCAQLLPQPPFRVEASAWCVWARA